MRKLHGAVLAVVCIAAVVAADPAGADTAATVHFTVNGVDPVQTDSTVHQPVAPGDDFVLTEVACGSAHEPATLTLRPYPDLGVVATATVDLAAGTGLLTTPADLAPGEFRLMLFCATDNSGGAVGYSARVFVAAGAFFALARSEAAAGTQFTATELNCGATGSAPARLDLLDSQEIVTASVDPVDLEAHEAVVPVPADAEPGLYTLRLTCAGAADPATWTESVTVEQAPEEPPPPADQPVAPAAPVMVAPAFTG